MITERPSLARGWYFILGLAVLAGVAFRFTHLPGKFFWWDEAASSLRMSGHYWDAIANEAPRGIAFPAREFLSRYERIEGSAMDTIRGLRREEPQLTPLYFLGLRGWGYLFGPGVTSLRAFSAILSVASLGLLYWLCQVLFSSTKIAMTTTAIAALSPLNLLYAQEARPYALMIFLTLLASLVLLKGLATRRRWPCVAYGAVSVAGIYTHLLFALVPIAHLAYLFANRASLAPRDRRRYGLAGVLALGSALPWTWVIATNYAQFEKTVGWTASPLAFSDLISTWAGHLLWPFFDIGLKEDIRSQFGELVTCLAVFVPFSLFAMVYTARRAPRRAWTFILLLQLITFASMAIPDVVLGGQRTTVARYLLPFHLGLVMCAGFLLADLKHRFSPALVLTFLLAQTWSCNLILQSGNWWHKGLLNHARVRAAADRLVGDEEYLVILAEPSPDLLTLGRVQPERTYFLIDSDAFRAGTLVANTVDPSFGVGRLQSFGEFLVYTSVSGAPLPGVADFHVADRE